MAACGPDALTSLYFERRQRKLTSAMPADKAYDEYISDPNKPVPYVDSIAQDMNGDYMTEDQRFASKRTDVLVYETEVLTEDFTIAGPITANLLVSTSGTDSDFDVKIVDVYPGDYPEVAAGAAPQPAHGVKMGAYQQLNARRSRSTGKFRNGFDEAGGVRTESADDNPTTGAAGCLPYVPQRTSRDGADSGNRGFR